MLVSASLLALNVDLTATATRTLPATGTALSHHTIQAQPNHAVVGWSFMPVAPSFGLQQSQVAMSTTEAEYIAMSQSLHDVLPIMYLIEEIKSRGFQVISTVPQVFCKVFEDNSSALELARLPKLRPRTKHINTCYHHFHEHICLGLIKIYPVGTADQTADVLTKALPQNDLQRHQKSFCGTASPCSGLFSYCNRESPGGSVRYLTFLITFKYDTKCHT